MHAVACFVTPDPEKREELLQTLRSLAEVIRREPGCLVCSVCIEEASAFFIVVSGWACDADLRQHLRSEHFQVLSGASRLLGASAAEDRDSAELLLARVLGEHALAAGTPVTVAAHGPVSAVAEADADAAAEPVDTQDLEPDAAR